MNYELSARKVADRIGIKFVDIPEFSCCGFPLGGIHHSSAVTIAARNLALAEAQGLNIIALCSACTGHMTEVEKLFANGANAKDLKRINASLKDLGYQYNGGVKVRHFARVLYEEIGVNKLRKLITDPLTGLKIAPHYGCHYIKPSEIFDGFDDPIHPQSLDKLIEITGATPVQYRDKLQCCGGGILAIDEETPVKMVKQKLDHIKEANVDAMILVCPFCNIMYDEFQPTVESTFDVEYSIPVLYYPQLLGLAMGLDPKKDLAVKQNQVKVTPLLEKIEGLRGGK
ncbi:MAG: CoB--CoM heterodisulfide reductase subunit B [Thermoplasmata archaeon]|nr:MAG: CoB--CoM heterodisulfide reductase subunit B [Thermoplasmata archaeon]